MFALDVAIFTRVYVLPYAMLLVAIYALVHAGRQRPDAFTAVDKLTKAKWMGIIGVSGLVVILFGYYGSGFILSLVATVAVFVYLADVRPKVDEVQRGPRW